MVASDTTMSTVMTRLQLPLKRVDDELTPTQWADALSVITEQLSEAEADDIVVIGSAQATNEDNYVLQTVRTRRATDNTSWGLFGHPQGEEHKFPQFTIEADKNPNTAGARDDTRFRKWERRFRRRRTLGKRSQVRKLSISLAADRNVHLKMLKKRH